MYRGHRIAVVMPVHNEQAHVERAVGRVPRFVDVIVAVDDGSTDDTWSVLSRLTDERVTKLRHSRNRGVGAATKTGYRHSLSVAADLIAVMDGDGQMDGSDLCSLIDRTLSGADFVKGNRFLDQKSIRKMPLVRFVGNSVFSWLTRRAVSFAGSLDAHCGYTVIRRQALERLALEELYDRYGFPTEMFFAAFRTGLAIESVAVRTVYDGEVSGINPFTAVPAILWLIARGCVRHRLMRERNAGLQRLAGC